MSDYKSILEADEAANQIAVDRVIAELRSARPVVIRSGRNHVIVTIVEALEPRIAAKLDALGRGRARLVLPAPRLRRLGLERTEPGHFALPKIDLARIATLALEVGSRFDAPVATLSSIDKAALELVRLALVLPAAIVVPVTARTAADSGLLSADAASIFEYRGRKVVDLQDRRPRAGAAGRRAGNRVRGVPRRRGPARPGRHSHRQAGSVEARVRCGCTRRASPATCSAA